MKKKIALFSGLSAAAVAVCVSVFLLYKNFAFGANSSVSLNSLQSAAFPVLAVIFGITVIFRFIVPFFVKKDSDEPKKLWVQYTDFAAWLFFALCLASLVASPLAETADYVGHAALFGVISVVFAFIPSVSLASDAAEKYCSSDNAFVSTVLGFLFSIIPGIGIYTAISGIVFSVTSLREEKLSASRGIALVSICIASLLLAAVSSFSFVYFLLIK